MSGKGSDRRKSTPSVVTTNCSLASVKRKLTRAQEERTKDKVHQLKVRQEQADAAIAKKGWRRCSPSPERDDERSSSSSASDSRRITHDRKGKGVIDRFAFQEEDYTRKRSSKPLKRGSTALFPGEHLWIGPQSGLPPPTPDPRCNPLPEGRSVGRVVTEKATWTGVTFQPGVLEWSRVNDCGQQEWLTASEVSAGEWSISRTKADRR